MRFLFGAIMMGVSADNAGVGLTGPTGDAWTGANTWAEHKPARGVPRLQEIGRELERRTLEFFFSAEFCDVGAEYGKLQAALATKAPGALVPFLGPYGGKRYVVDKLRTKVKKTTMGGSLVRVEGTLDLIESPATATGLLSGASSLAQAAAPALALKAGVGQSGISIGAEVSL